MHMRTHTQISRLLWVWLALYGFQFICCCSILTSPIRHLDPLSLCCKAGGDVSR
uniref:Uncharacterized protein n=1 Tax=Anguilla anguilla TaxID=7936 RepID=A0A0E9T2T3_ANGAN